MVERVGWTLRWAQGLGRQSGLLALNALALVGVPFLYSLQPCSDAVCTSVWDKLFFVPNLLFIPAIAATLWLWGSWRGQRRHERFQKRYFASLPPREVPDTPPGHVQPPGLERDLARRSLRGLSLGALLAAGALAAIGTAPFGIGLRRCDPVSFSWHTGLERCATASEWIDALVAFQVWTFLVLSLAAAVVFAWRIKRYREPVAEAPKPARVRTSRA